MRKERREDYRNRSSKNRVIGRVKRNTDGFGFLIPDDKQHADVYLPRYTMTGIMSDDRVEAEVRRESDGRFSGEVREILNRAVTQVVGKYQHNSSTGEGLILDESKGWGANLTVDRENAGGARNGDLVAIRILTYSDSREGFTGEVIEVLGQAGDPLLDTKSVLYEHHVPIEFSPGALKDANALPGEVRETDWQGRRDLRDKSFVTIDGATARDFDDAVYAEKEAGGFRLWVAIADVAHYVKEGTHLDQSAYERGTSVYFPDMVVPMLPEKLSNGLCSLNPHVPRLAMVCEMRLDHMGVVIDSEIYEAVFTSRHRMIYGEVEDIINGQENPKFTDVLPMLNLMRDVATILMKKRFREGSLDLEIPEAQVLIDASGVPTDIVRGERLFAHRLIEEFMLLANVSVAKFISKAGAPCLYRVHDEPFADALKALELMAHNWGLKIRFSGAGSKRHSTKDNDHRKHGKSSHGQDRESHERQPSGSIQKQLMRMLEHVRGKPEENILSILILRSMKQAQYAEHNIGHFGLAFPFYTHFTSPIRRYPDLVVHRVLKKIIYRQKNSEKISSEEELARMQTMGTFLSACEQRAVQCERDLLAIKRCRFLERHVGQVFEGMITGIAKFGIFVQLRAYDIDGLVKLETLRGDQFKYDEENQRLIGKFTHTVIKLGEIVQVRVMRADPEAREIDFEWVDQKHAPADDRPTNWQDSEERRETARNRSGFREAWLSQRAGKGKARPVHPKKGHQERRTRKSKRR